MPPTGGGLMAQPKLPPGVVLSRRIQVVVTEDLHAWTQGQVDARKASGAEGPHTRSAWVRRLVEREREDLAAVEADVLTARLGEDEPHGAGRRLVAHAVLPDVGPVHITQRSILARGGVEAACVLLHGTPGWEAVTGRRNPDDDPDKVDPVHPGPHAREL